MAQEPYLQRPSRRIDWRIGSAGKERLGRLARAGVGFQGWLDMIGQGFPDQVSLRSL